MRPSITHVDQLRQGAFAGNPCFILATGPSIAGEDLAPLRDCYTFGTGHIIEWQGLPFIPTLYGFDEALERHGDNRRTNTAWEAVKETPLCGFIRGMPSYNSTRWYNVGHPLTGLEIADGWLGGLTDNPMLQNIPSQAGISAFALGLQPALWLGFEPIYFLGLDLSDEYVYGGRRQPDVLRAATDVPSHWVRMMRSVKVVYEQTQAMGRTVVNLSQGTNEDVLPKDTLTAVLARMKVAA